MAIVRCVDRGPVTKSDIQAELMRQLQTGVPVDGGFANFGSLGELVKKIKFGAPIYTTLPELDMISNAACVEALDRTRAQGMDLETMYIVQEALFAEIVEQTCGKRPTGAWLGWAVPMRL